MGDFNKKDGELDFSNIKQSQLGMGNVIRASFSELQSGLRVLNTNALLKDAYTHFTQTLNGSGLPTHVEYWQATSPSKYEITFVADVASSLSNTYVIFEEYITKRTVLLYYDVSGAGVAPGIADEEYPVSILANDSATIVARSTYNVLKTLTNYFKVKPVGSSLYTIVEIEFTKFGDASPINLGTTGFSSTETKVGTSFKVGEVYLDYDVNGNPIYNGNTLTGLLYNTYTASFDVNSSTASIAANTGPLSDVIYDVKDVTTSATLLAVGVANQEGRRTITIQPKGKTIWYGFDNTVTSGNSGKSFKLSSNSFATISLAEDEEVYAVTSSGTGKVAVSEGK